MELKITHESSDQNYFFPLNMLPTCPVFVPHLWHREELNLSCLKLIPLNSVVDYKCSVPCCSSVAHVACWTSPLPQCCVMTGGPGREKLDKHIIALLEIGDQPELHLNLWLSVISSQTSTLWFQQHFLILGYFRERFTANQNQCSLAGVLCTSGWELGIEIRFL